MTTRYCVTKQIQYPDGDRVVEISIGTFDYVNPDCLSDGIKECETAIEAVEYAIELAQKWQTECGEEVFIGKGYTAGSSMPFDPWELCEDTYSRLRAWARERDADLPRCDHCGDIIDREWKHYHYDERFCSMYCLETFLEENAQYDDPEEELNEDLEMPNATQLQINTGLPLTVRLHSEWEEVGGDRYFTGYYMEEILGLPVQPQGIFYTRSDVYEWLNSKGIPTTEVLFDFDENDLELVVV